MEKKTIGGFIATLRKANGMTQKELAEKLNVSDKTISRWERDDGAPDLSVIPVIAEIFGVTCDELLRGEKRSINEKNDGQVDDVIHTAKAEKQKKWLVQTTMTKYKSKTTISLGIALAGLVGAMIANFGFLRAYVGFFTAIIFYLVSVICQIIFTNEAKLSLASEELDTDGVIDHIRKDITKLLQKYFGTMIFLVCFNLPLVVFPWDTYMGVVFITWFVYGFASGILSVLVYIVICYFVNAHLIKNEKWVLSEKQNEFFWYNHKLKKKCAIILGVVLFVTYAGMYLVELLPIFVPEGIEFDNYDEFIEFMEKEVYIEGDDYIQAVIVEDPFSTESGDIEYSSKEEHPSYRTIEDKNGKTVCGYIENNRNVSYMQYKEGDGTVLPITVYTIEEERAIEDRIFIKNMIFGCIYVVEVVIAFIIYFNKRKNGGKI